GFVRASSKLTCAVPPCRLTVASDTPGSAVSTRVTLATQPPQLMPSTLSVTVVIDCSSLDSLLRAPAAQQQRVADHRYRARRHRGASEYRIQHAERSERNAQHVVDEGKEKVLPDLGQGRAGKQYGVGDGERGRVVDAVADHAGYLASRRQRADGRGLFRRQYAGAKIIDADLRR